MKSRLDPIRGPVPCIPSPKRHRYTQAALKFVDVFGHGERKLASTEDTLTQDAPIGRSIYVTPATFVTLLGHLDVRGNAWKVIVGELAARYVTQRIPSSLITGALTKDREIPHSSRHRERAG